MIGESSYTRAPVLQRQLRDFAVVGALALLIATVAFVAVRNTELAARIASYELAYRMQGCAPGAVDVASESEVTKKLYGLDDKITEPFGRQCLMARRLVEHGVRFVQIYAGGVGNQNTDTIAVFRIQPSNGKLKLSTIVNTPTPVDIEFGPRA